MKLTSLSRSIEINDLTKEGVADYLAGFLLYEEEYKVDKLIRFTEILMELAPIEALEKIAALYGLKLEND